VSRTGKSSLILLVLAWASCSGAIERPGDAGNAKELQRRTTAVTAIQRDLLAIAEGAPHGEQFELYRTYDESMGTWLQVGFLRDLVDASIATTSASDELRLRADLRDQARYTLWELDQNIAHLDASTADGRSQTLRLIKALRASLVNVRLTVIRLAANP